jgi:putative phage-type endonuclease
MAFWKRVNNQKTSFGPTTDAAVRTIVEPAVAPESFVPTLYPYYEIADLVQGTEAWLVWRRRVIGASDAPVIMKENRWTTSQYLMDEKLGIKQGFGGNAATREGHRLEGEARRLLAKKCDVQLEPTIIQDGKIPYLAASLDAINKAHTRVFEIKCGEKSYSLAASRNEIPIYYMAQLQHILMISQLEMITYAAYRPYEPLVIIEVGRNEAYIRRMREAEEDFGALLVAKGHELQGEYRGRQISR